MGSMEESAHPTPILPKALTEISELLGKELGVRVYIIGARALMLHGISLGRETRDWDVTITAPFTLELRDRITHMLRMRGYKVQWRKWGFLVENDIHVDINYAPLILDAEWEARSKKLTNNIYLPSIEDLIVLKLMSGERKDVNDVKRVIAQKPALDWHYLFRRAQQAGLEKQLTRLLKRLGVKP